MSVNGIASANDTPSAYVSSKPKSTKVDKTTEKTAENVGAVYEPSKESSKASTKKYTPDTNMIAKLKADADAKTAQLQSLVEKMLTKQGQAYCQANDIWSILSSGDFTVDPATKAQAQADIADDGYWGVSQTSQRILDFATALTGGDPDKIEEMRSAFEKGYKQAEEIWGGKLPDISKKTYDAVMQGFDKLAGNTEVQA